MTRTQKQDAAEAGKRRQLVDEFGKLDRELQPHRAKLRRHEELAKLVRSWHAGLDPEAPLTAEGDEFQVVLSPVGFQNHITDLGEIYRLLGRAKFLAIASVTIKALEAALPATAASLLEKRRTGSRTLTIVQATRT